MEIREMNIYEKMSQITDELVRIAKNLQVGVGKSSYKAVGEADVLASVKPLENKYRVYSYPTKREIVYSNEFTTTSEYNGEVKEKLTMFMRLKTTYRFINIDKPEEYIEVETFGDGVDTQDKAPGKAMTYADKYALLKAYKIETGEDPDQNASQQMNKTTSKYTEEVKEVVIGGEYKFTSGKYNGKTVQEVIDEGDVDYIAYCINAPKVAPFIKANLRKAIADNNIILESEVF